MDSWLEKENWKDVKNPDLWKKVGCCLLTEKLNGIGSKGMLDMLVMKWLINWPIWCRTNGSTKMKSLVQANADTKKPESDWLLDDPFGLDLDEDIDNLVEEFPKEISIIEEITSRYNTVNGHSISPNTSTTTTVHPQIVITLRHTAYKTLSPTYSGYRNQVLFPRW